MRGWQKTEHFMSQKGGRNPEELGRHGSFELPVANLNHNCVIFQFPVQPLAQRKWEVICIEIKACDNKAEQRTIRLKQGDILMVNSGVIHGIRSDLGIICITKVLYLT